MSKVVLLTGVSPDGKAVIDVSVAEGDVNSLIARMEKDEVQSLVFSEPVTQLVERLLNATSTISVTWNSSVIKAKNNV